MTKKLHRSRTQKVFAGVAGGIGEYFDIDPVFIRAGFILSIFAWGGGILAYFILWIIVPKREFEIVGSAPDGTPIGKEVTDEPVNIEINIESDTSPQKRNMIIGLMLIIIGSLIFLDNVLPDIFFDEWWPLLLVAFGVYLIYVSIIKSRGRNERISEE